MNDPIGQAIKDYFEKGEAEDIIVNTSYTEDERLSPGFFFRKWEEMPELERIALDHSRGKVLDVGAAAGRHALILQQRGLEVTALEQSSPAAEVMKKRGVKNVVCSGFLDFNEKRYDTLLVLMNGTGLGQTLEGLIKMLLHLKSLLNEGGQILIDSSDIRYLFEEEDGSMWVNLANDRYYGEMEYELIYKNLSSQFKWLFTDSETLTAVAKQAGMTCQVISRGDQNDFLAKLTVS